MRVLTILRRDVDGAALVSFFFFLEIKVRRNVKVKRLIRIKKGSSDAAKENRLDC